MMNNIVANFDQIVDFGKGYGLPMTKKKAILREYLQTKILDLLYQEKNSSQFIFVGGTALRLTRNMNRFSEDLDFDLAEISLDQVDKTVRKIYRKLVKQNIDIDLYHNQTKERLYHEFRFTNLLFDLNLSRQRDEKLTIKFDYEQFWQQHNKQVKIINRYGYLVKSITIPLNQHLVQKLTAYLKRKQTQPRDIYDIVWLIAQGAKIDWDFVKVNDLDENLINQAREKFESEKSKLSKYQSRLQPFLINESHLDKLDLFPELLK